MSQTGRHRHLIFAGSTAPLESVAFHRSSDGIERIAWQRFPVHISTHRVTDIRDMPERYVSPHCHREPEINLIIADGDELVYEITLGDETYTVAAPCAIWIPAGLSHSANVVRGSGFFMCTVFTREYQALPIAHVDGPAPDGRELPRAG